MVLRKSKLVERPISIDQPYIRIMRGKTQPARSQAAKRSSPYRSGVGFGTSHRSSHDWQVRSSVSAVRPLTNT